MMVSLAGSSHSSLGSLITKVNSGHCFFSEGRILRGRESSGISELPKIHISSGIAGGEIS